MAAEEWALAASAFCSGLAAGLLGMLSTIMRPMLAVMNGRDFRTFMEAFLRYAEQGWGRLFNYAWSLGMGIGPIVALVFLWDDPGSTSFVLTAIGLGVVIVGVYVVSNVWKEPLYKVILAWDPENMPACDQASCAQPDFSTCCDQPMCVQLDTDDPTVRFGAHRLIAICRKVRLDAHRLIVRSFARRLGATAAT